jgi:general secretion pathway protein K
MKIRAPRRQEGIAIFIVLVAIFALSMLAAAFAYSMKIETRLAANSDNGPELDCLGRSGVEIARWMLSDQMKVAPYTSLGQVWAGGPGETNDPLAGFDFSKITSITGLPGIIHQPRIVEAESKFNINNIFGNEELVQRALIDMGVDAAAVPGIIACIEDWIDADDDTRINGAESDYYQGLNPPYSAKNGPIDDISELLFVKGITPDIFTSNGVATAVQPKEAGGPGVMPNAAVITNTTKMVDVFTTISNGRINVNTASSTVLQMIPGIDENAADQIIAARGNTPDQAFRTIGDLGGIDTSLGNQLQGILSQYANVRGSVYEVSVDVELGMSKRTYYALLVANNPTDIQILNMYWQ